MELLIQLSERQCNSEQQAAQLSCRGDVISFHVDGYPWSEKDLNQPGWVVVRVPITKVEAEALVSPEIDYGQVKRYCYWRQYSLDIDAMKLRESNKVQKMRYKVLTPYMKHKGCACGK